MYFLELVLIVGNYMGSSVKSFKGAYAFEMNTLTKVKLSLKERKPLNHENGLVELIVLDAAGV